MLSLFLFACSTLVHADPAADTAERTYRLTLAAVPKDPMGQAIVYSNLGALYLRQGRLRESASAYSQAVKLREKAGDEGKLGASLNNLAEVRRRQGKASEAAALYRRALPLLEHAGARSDVAVLLNNMGVLEAERGRAAEAERLLMQALELKIQLYGDQHKETAVTRRLLATVRGMLTVAISDLGTLRDSFHEPSGSVFD